MNLAAMEQSTIAVVVEELGAAIAEWELSQTDQKPFIVVATVRVVKLATSSCSCQKRYQILAKALAVQVLQATQRPELLMGAAGKLNYLTNRISLIIIRVAIKIVELVFKSKKQHLTPQTLNFIVRPEAVG